MPITLDDMRRFTVARSLFPPTTLKRALDRMGFVQADPIRAPARAQDLILRHRVKGYCAGDLERRYAKLGVHEDFFVNYGFVTEELQALMHPRGTPRSPRTPWFGIRNKKAQALGSSFARGELCTRKKSISISRTARSRTIGEGSRTPLRICLISCTTKD